MNKALVGGEPVYIQIATLIRDEIVKGTINPGEMLDSETTLVAKYNASRETVRKSLKELEHQGFIYSRPGKGYFVAEPVHGLFSIDFEDEDSGLDVRLDNVNVISPTAEIQDALSVSSQQLIIKISRIILRSDDPIAYDVKYLPYDKGTPIIEAEIKYAVFPEIATKKAAPFGFFTRMQIGVETASAEVKRALHCSDNEPLLVVTRYIIGANKQKIGYGKKYMRSSYGQLEAYSGYINIK
jgi:Transcriptional regulators